MITSHFLHAYIVVRPVGEGDRYMVSVTARGDVPYFGPSIPSPAVFVGGARLKEFILTKLINAQMACLKAEEFSKLELRTRTTLLNNLEEELSNKTQEFIGGDAAPPATVTRLSLLERFPFLLDWQRLSLPSLTLRSERTTISNWVVFALGRRM